MQTAKQRNTSFELLRILCIMGIICMHALAPVWQNSRFVVLSVLGNSLFNMGVTCFVLISGFFGARLTIQKWLGMEAIVLFGGLLMLIEIVQEGGTIGLSALKDNLLPCISKKYWFYTCYVCLALLAPYIERLLSALSQRNFLELMIVLFVFFYLLPTCTFGRLTDDSGKGLPNMLVVYILGRYLRLYPVRRTRRQWLILYFASLTLTIGLNLGFSGLQGEVVTRFARDNSLFTLLQAVAVFQLFAAANYHWPIVNKLAKFVFPAYIYNNIILTCYLPVLSEDVLGKYTALAVLGIVAATVVLTFIICILLEAVRRIFVFPLAKWMSPKVDTFANNLSVLWNRMIEIVFLHEAKN